MSLLRALIHVVTGRCERIAVPGKFKVWRQDGVVHVEVLR